MHFNKKEWRCWPWKKNQSSHSVSSRLICHWPTGWWRIQLIHYVHPQCRWTVWMENILRVKTSFRFFVFVIFFLWDTCYFGVWVFLPVYGNVRSVMQKEHAVVALKFGNVKCDSWGAGLFQLHENMDTWFKRFSRGLVWSCCCSDNFLIGRMGMYLSGLFFERTCAHCMREFMR